MTAAAAARLLEREPELAAMGALIAGVLGGAPDFVVVDGPAGIGKTMFLATVEERACSRGIRVMRAAGAEFERGLAFGAATQLFQAPLRSASEDERSRLLGGAARLGGELLGFGTGDDVVERAVDPGFAAFHGLYWLCANLAAQTPLLILVDDAHWLDDQSLGWLEYLARRREGLAVLLVVATRRDEQVGQRLARTAGETGGHLVELPSLSRNGVGALAEAALDQPAHPAFVAALQVATGGNPFLVHEVLRTIRERAVAPDAHGADVVRTLGSERIARTVLHRLHRLSPASVELARAIAILGRSGSLSVAARLADLADSAAARALEALIGAEILARGPDLRFIHPVVRASVYGDMPAPARARHHRRAARLMAGMGAPTAEVASQIMAADPVGDRWTVEVLRAAAADARSRGAATSAITLLERALAERPASDDPDLLLELGRAALDALDVPKAIDALSRALARAEPARRGAAALDLARVLLHAGRVPEAVRLIEGELEKVGGIEPELRIWLEVEYLVYGAPRRDAREATRRFRNFSGDSVAELAALAAAAAMADTAQEAADLARRALVGGTLVHALDAASTWFLAPWMLIRADRLEQAEDVVDEAMERSRLAGSRAGFARCSWLRAEIDHRRGHLVGAEAHARSAHAIASEGGSLWVRLMSGALLAQILADRGEPAEADEVLAGLDMSMLRPTERLTRTVHYARAYVAQLAGRPAQAVVELARLGEDIRAAPAWRARFSTGMAIQAMALVDVGRVEGARRVAEEELAWARTWGTPRFVGLALRARAHTTEDTERVRELEEAVATLERSPAGLELARALGDLGSTLRRRNQRVAAREPLRRALDLARRCRAEALAHQLHGELRAAGAKPRRDVLTGRAALTSSEDRIAEMAATGMTNAQIAQALFLTAGTVEKHLTSTYAKLGISSRSRLAAVMGSTSSADAPPSITDQPS